MQESTGQFGEFIFSNLWIVMRRFGIKEKPIDSAQRDWLIRVAMVLPSNTERWWPLSDWT